MENFLVHYATYNWQSLFFESNLDQKLLKLIYLIFGLIFFCILILRFKRKNKTISKLTQTDSLQPENSINDCIYLESSNFLLNYIFQHYLCFTNILTQWIANFNDFQLSNIISKNCKILKFDKDASMRFKCFQVKIIENKEILSFTFRMICEKLSLIVSLKHDSNLKRNADIILKDLEVTALVIVQMTVRGLLVKFCPESVLGFTCDLSADGISLSEREMSVTEFSRDFKLVILKTLEMEWAGQIGQYPSVNEIDHIDQFCQVDLFSNETSKSHPITNDNSPESCDTNEQYHQVSVEEDTQEHVTLEHNFQDIHAEKRVSDTSLLSLQSYNCCQYGEESPFHDRFSSKLIGRTLVVGLVKIVEAEELKVPLKKGYCVLELDEPYQRHVSHLISLVDYPVWNQHFIFSLNSNSQRISVELFQTSKKCQSPIALGISLIPISFIIVGPTENSFPININQFGSRTSWRCDNSAGTPDSKIPAFVIDFQIMKNVEDPLKSYVEASSEKSSNSEPFVSTEFAGKSLDADDINVDSGNEMKIKPELQTFPNQNTQLTFDQSKVFLHRKPNDDEPHNSRSVMHKLRNRFSQFSAPWATGKSKSDDCLDKMSDENISKPDRNEIVPIQPPTELFPIGTKSKLVHKRPDIELNHSRGLSISLKKMLSFQTKKSLKNDQDKDKSLEHLFKAMDSKLFDSISKEGFDRIMNNDSHTN